MLDDPSNMVWVPRLKHEQISGYYSSTSNEDPLGRRWRYVIDEEDFATQRAVGLEQLRAKGVLK
jgi:hypothetical protein